MVNNPKNELELLHIALQNNESAIGFCKRIFQFTQVLDDLIDKDKPVTDDMVKQAFWDLLVEIPSNKFYQQYFEHLQPVLRGMFLDWEDANDLEKGTDLDKTVAYVIRDSISMLVVHCALMIGGRDWARKISVMVRRFVHDEPIQTYKENLNG